MNIEIVPVYLPIGIVYTILSFISSVPIDERLSFKKYGIEMKSHKLDKNKYSNIIDKLNTLFKNKKETPILGAVTLYHSSHMCDTAEGKIKIIIQMTKERYKYQYQYNPSFNYDGTIPTYEEYNEIHYSISKYKQCLTQHLTIDQLIDNTTCNIHSGEIINR